MITRFARGLWLATLTAATAATAGPGETAGQPAWESTRAVARLDTSATVHTLPDLGAALAPEVLATLRGGFTDSSGLRFAFSFDRVTRLNGEALSQVSVILPMFSLVDGHTGPAFTTASQHMATLSTINGMDSTMVANPASGALHSSGLPLMIQNALDNQHIENLTLINLDIFGTDTLRGSTIRNLIETTSIESLRP